MVVLTLKAEPGRDRNLPHGTNPGDLAKVRRRNRRINRRVIRYVENISSLRAKFHHTRFVQWDDLGERHVKNFAPRSDDAVAARVAILAGGSSIGKGCGIEPLCNRGMR